MNMKVLETFAQTARRQLQEQVAAKLSRILTSDSLERRANPKAVKELEQQIDLSSQEAVIERVAYTWFNRFCALRYMDVNRYTPMGIVSPTEGFTQPELLQEAKQGHINDDLAMQVDQQVVFDLLGGRRVANDPQQEAYRLLLVTVCNYYHKTMPFMFEKIADYTELLMPDDLLSVGSILQAVRNALTPEACQNVEVIGWLYQFYISEKKDAVFASKDKVSADDIPAATQLFTPNWIVRYLVENSLGRLWMLNHPESRLVEKMAYYIQPEQEEEDFLKINSPEALRICDPACGSGHMLVYAFDLLYAIYEEAGYVPSDIPSHILTHNLYGIEIDERAGVLAAFALTMKARDKYRRFFRNPVQPNICVMENISFSPDEINNYMAHVGKDLFTQDFWVTVRQFTDAKHFGSLIRPQMKNAGDLRTRLEESGAFSDMFLHSTNTRMRKLLQMADYLSPKYHVVVANPPYMGGAKFNSDLKDFAKDEYKDSKSDFFAMFIERGFELVRINGYNAMVTMESWMFLSSYEKMRETLLSEATLQNMIHMPYLGKGGTSMGINFGTAATIFKHKRNSDFKGTFMCIRYYEIDDVGIPLEFPTINERYGTASATDFKKIPGSLIAYWVSNGIRETFANSLPLSMVLDTREGMTTANNDLFLRLWYEVALSEIVFSEFNTHKWFPYVKGGDFRRWWGNLEYLVNWENDGEEIKKNIDLKTGRIRSHNYNGTYAFKQGLAWTALSSGKFSVRFVPEGCMFDATGPMGFNDDIITLYEILALMNSSLASVLVDIVAPTLKYGINDILKLPVQTKLPNEITNNLNIIIKLSKTDWDSYETSWDFNTFPLLHDEHRAKLLEDTYANLRQHWQAMTRDMQALEEENNRIFIEAYGLQDELSPEVPLSEITLTCNPHYRYGGKNSEDELEARLLADTMREFISYAVGCMFGRYALEKGGLILANQGETLDDYLRRVPNSPFPADKDNVIPILDDSWFNDDIVERFHGFLRLTFGEDHFNENLRFIEEAIGRDIRSYFVRDFYGDHIKRYSKRPIYWLFSSPNGSFNALVYMHRYRPDTVSVVLNDYLREFRTKLTAHRAHLEHMSISGASSAREKTAALKEITSLDKVLKELTAYENEVLYPLATQQVTIDLDDGVKVNYNKFGAALKAVPGLTQR